MTGVPERLGGKPRKNADDAYATFMDMNDHEFLAAAISSMGGWLFESAEQEGYLRAAKERGYPPPTGSRDAPDR